MLSALASEVPSAMARRDAPHVPVLLAETLEGLRAAPGLTIVDATLGPGGHAEALAEAVGPSGRVVGIDRDPGAIAFARHRLAPFGDRFVPLWGDHRDLAALLRGAAIPVVDAVLADLGISSLQLDDPSRGFSFSADGPLDMRLEPGGGTPSAADLVATLDVRSLAEVLSRWGEERDARKIAGAIVRERERAPITTTGRLSEVVARAAGPAARRFKIHPATRTFQALRIAVNREIEGIPELVQGASEILRPGGRLAVISFHSLEDRAVKQTMRELAHRCVCPPGLPVCACGREDVFRIVTARPIVPSDAEVRANPRARSAKLRVAERV
ncbi:MAG TPA: 16S rRNA (cytosine(1402)-N(4))-methyltransferase RsmH [Candidatus Sulfotelmatobacter sp.]|jgi:16S rRNA (cytosine1402-N4)-methyltransferase|nr:16S rRNA (cytosine(1402)-N(4))-methyltransferase RsmH [Candidatus Sulfotelmatobacter sp.]